jgi:acetolactate decarboxylase
MARDIIDDRLIGALHVRALTHRGFAHDPAAERVAFQVGTLDALIDGRFDGDTTIRELLAHGDLGLGTVQHLGGELVVLDGHAFVIDADGRVHEVPPSTRTPFAVVCRFAARDHLDLEGPMSLAQVQRTLDGLAPHAAVIAVRVDGAFTHLRLRSVREQVRPYPPLAEVTAHQTEWDLERAEGTLLGFRFPDDVAGLEAPGYHLHFLSGDREHGGHVLDGTLVTGVATVDGDDQLHVELPPGVELGTPGVTDRARIRLVEGGPASNQED